MKLLQELYEFTDSLPSGVMIFSPEGAAVYANRTARELLGVVAEAAAPLDYFLAENGEPLLAENHPVAVALREGKASGWKMLGVQRASGYEPVWLRVQAAPVMSDSGVLQYLVVSLEDASEERRLKRELDEFRECRSSETPSGVFPAGPCGRMEANVLLARAVVEAREKEYPLAVCLLDLDMFKRLNQAFGRRCGDEVLQYVAETLGACLRPEDLFSRMNGGEFLVAMPGLTLKEAWQEMDRFRTQLASTVVPCTGRAASVSGGVVMMRDDEDAPALLERVDSLLYLAKLDGRNRIVPDSAI
ncbi:sensor domain-containing diguanylate cyclase [Desulfovibrio mangrovi]|uniref:GGDEF domain-containing protein n=1 Tax=Desulfovibrio mangrovi TaxID=2976983 RepID=UPI0022467528|nr:sensor domain-containing diguanylate cyclase [Desulfovibrio mangrovi]UZP67370.1 sensor domain-containing diguanylate cyclase [Desulfovibrio mangrovi]